MKEVTMCSMKISEMTNTCGIFFVYLLVGFPENCFGNLQQLKKNKIRISVIKTVTKRTLRQ